MARERGAFAFADVVEAICDKLIRRHPHVFADERVDTAQAQTARWEEHKARERNRRLPTAADGGGDRPGGDEAGALDGVPRALPALLRAAKLQKRAALVGFDWPDAEAPLAKFAEESRELADEMAAGAGIDRLRDELGDLLFTAVNVARKLAIDPEQALRQANDKFERRFRRIEAMLREDGGRRPADAGLVELDALWERAKANE
jgi:MazG family protein